MINEAYAVSCSISIGHSRTERDYEMSKLSYLSELLRSLAKVYVSVGRESKSVSPMKGKVTDYPVGAQNIVKRERMM